MSAPAPRPLTDKRLLRGARTRSTVLRRAVDLASLDGLEGLSFGRIAADTGLSKAGVQTLFRTKEILQLAAVDHARDLFIEAVVDPARAEARGGARLRALVENWIVYAETPLFLGGCFRAANMTEFDSKPGPVRDALLRDQRDWRALLANQFRHAATAGESAQTDPQLAAFQLDAVLLAANTALRLDDSTVISKVRRVLDQMLRPPG
ncbi:MULTISPECIES: TetR/AcrR family transcriptional regulator [Nocardia]|uniref:TetR/AcrR family transcriptional regulator n=1 Tax=Nocardia TaxID=1817 RepID=UPI000D68577F|nr:MULTISPECIES: TetR/AcrR family transcriptional regulator [Nocardia]